MQKELHILADGQILETAQVQEFFPDEASVSNLVERGALSELNDGALTASFVGVAVSQSSITAFFPKGLSIPTDETAKCSVTRLILKSLKKYSLESPRYPDAYRLSQNVENPNVSEVALAQWLIDDYWQNGLYRRKRSLTQRGGSGQIAWQKTIDNVPAYLSNGQPVYLDVLTRGSTSDDSHLASRLHLSALTHCTEKYGVLFGADVRMLDHETVEPIPTLLARDMADRVLGRELNRVFNDRAIRLMKVLHAFYSRKIQTRRQGLEIHGTSSFEHVWEVVCGKVIGNHIGDWIHTIPFPKWTSVGGETQEAKTLRPDIVRNFSDNGLARILLADAKYYQIRMPPELSGNPGVGDVSKQLLYEIFLRKEAQQKKVIFSGNAFVFPGPQQRLIAHAGEVGISGLNAGPVQVYFLSVLEGLKRYIEELELNDSEVASEFKITIERATTDANSKTS